MDETTLIALKNSIAKYEHAAATGEIITGVYNCPLCQLFYHEDCDGCPIAGDYGEHRRCKDTPYDWFESDEGEDAFFNDDFEEIKKHAQAELDFLRSLLPTEELPNE